MPLLPIKDGKRKQVPVYSGFLCYFPDAIVAVAQHSFESNEQHNPGEPLHWNRAKSMDQLNTLARHLLEVADGGLDPDEELAAAKAIAWRSMAHLQILIEKRRHARVPPIDHLCVTGANGECVTEGKCMHSPPVENSESKKLAAASEDFWNNPVLTDAERQAASRADILALAREGDTMAKIIKSNNEYIERLNTDYGEDT